MINYEYMIGELVKYRDSLHLHTVNLNILDIVAFTLIFACLDRFLLPAKSRWFSLHTISNSLTTYYSFGDLILTWANPFESTKIMNWRPLNITVTLHFYHMLFFRNLSAIDWIHHIVMMYVAVYMYMLPLGAPINAVIFFVNGLPGCIDYFLLTLVKHNKISPNTEKFINVYLNNWIRSPGLLISSYISLLVIGHNMDKFKIPSVIPHFIPGYYIIDNILGLLIPIALYWNAQYFNQRVLLNYVKRNTETSEQFEDQPEDDKKKELDIIKYHVKAQQDEDQPEDDKRKELDIVKYQVKNPKAT